MANGPDVDRPQTGTEPSGDVILRRGRFDAVVEFNRPVCREHYLLRLRIIGPCPSVGRVRFPATLPGQFVQLGCRSPMAAGIEGIGSGERDRVLGREVEWEAGQRAGIGQMELCGASALLRRPFSLAGRGDDERGTWLEVVHRVVGVGTLWLSELSEGDAVDLIGPLGNGFELRCDKSLGLLVGGGVGLPPMFYLAERLKQEGWDAVAFVGATRGDLLAVGMDPDIEPDPTGLPKHSVREFARFDYPTVVTTDDGSRGLRGRITAGLEPVLAGLPGGSSGRAMLFVCGPEPMMRAVSDLAERYGVDCQLCLEQAMACGMGTCQSCVVRTAAGEGRSAQGTTPDGRAWRYRLACTDGPVFDRRSVVW